MDGLDATILRSMLRTNEWSLRGVDPLLSPAEIGLRVGRSASTVRRRLASWRSTGFLRGISPLPNPALLGLEVQLHLLSVDGPDHRESFERELELLETPALVYQMGVGYAVFTIARGAHTSARVLERLRRVPHLHRLNEPIPIEFPAPARPMRRPDWELLVHLRSQPTLDPRALCVREGGSARSCRRRLASWRDGDLVFFLPLLDFEHARGTVAWIGGVLDRSVELETMGGVVAGAFPDRIPIQQLFPIQRMLPPNGENDGPEAVLFFLPVPTAQAAEASYARFARLPGIRHAMLAFPTRNYSLSSVVDDAIAEALERTDRAEERIPSGVTEAAAASRIRALPTIPWGVATAPDLAPNGPARLPPQSVMYRSSRGELPRRAREPN